MSALGQKQIFASQKVHVRFTPESGHFTRAQECQLRAISEHFAVQSLRTLFSPSWLPNLVRSPGQYGEAHTLPHFPVTGIFKKVPIMRRYDLPLALAAAWLSEL
jgi:hypothetical protein